MVPNSIKEEAGETAAVWLLPHYAIKNIKQLGLVKESKLTPWISLNWRLIFEDIL